MILSEGYLITQCVSSSLGELENEKRRSSQLQIELTQAQAQIQKLNEELQSNQGEIYVKNEEIQALRH